MNVPFLTAPRATEKEFGYDPGQMLRRADEAALQIIEDAARGRRIILCHDSDFEVPGSCPACRGIGFLWLVKKYRCRECGGNGRAA